jgi:hypothetical protein
MPCFVAKGQQDSLLIGKSDHNHWTKRRMSDYLQASNCEIPVFNDAVWQLRRSSSAVRHVSWGVCEFISVEVSNDQA